MSKNPITPPEHVCLPESGEPLHVPRRSDDVPAEAWVPYPKPIPHQWHVIAAEKGFSIHSRIRDRYHLCLRCNSCGALTAQKVFTLRTAQPACVACQCNSREALAQAAGLEFMYRDSKDRHYGMFRAPCGHKISRQFAFLERIAAGEVEHRCEHCLQDRERTEAERIGWSFLSRDMDNADYRIYRHSCGHVQRVARVNMRWGQVDCAGCGQSWCSRPSYIYLLRITWPDTNQQLIKVGFSAHPDKRFRHQLGLPDSATVDLLRTLPFETGHEACRVEKGMHSHLCKTHPDAVVPCTELEGHINVVSEVYRPHLLPVIHALFDRVGSEQVRQVRIGTPWKVARWIWRPFALGTSPASRAAPAVHTLSPYIFAGCHTHSARLFQHRTALKDVRRCLFPRRPIRAAERKAGVTVYRRHTLLGTQPTGQHDVHSRVNPSILQSVLKVNFVGSYLTLLKLTHFFSSNFRESLLHFQVVCSESVMCTENEFTRAKKALADLKTQPPKRSDALMALVRELVDQIQDAMRRGYTLPEILAALNAKRGPDDQINYFTFRNYLQKARAERGLAPVQPKRAKAPARAPARPHPEMTRPKAQVPSAPRQPDAQKAHRTSSHKTLGRNMKEGL